MRRLSLAALVLLMFIIVIGCGSGSDQQSSTGTGKIKQEPPTTGGYVPITSVEAVLETNGIKGSVSTFLPKSGTAAETVIVITDYDAGIKNGSTFTFLAKPTTPLSDVVKNQVENALGLTNAMATAPFDTAEVSIGEDGYPQPVPQPLPLYPVSVYKFERVPAPLGITGDKLVFIAVRGTESMSDWVSMSAVKIRF